MTKEIEKKQKIIVLRDGTQIWLEWERAERFEENLQKITESKFVKIDEETINTADITGVLKPKTIEETVRRRNGQWKDNNGKWRNKGDYVCPQCGNAIPRGKQCGYC